MAGFANLNRPRKLLRGRVCAVFGPKGVGKTTILRTVTAETRTALVVGTASVETETAVAAAQDRGAEVIFIDGMPTSPEDVQWLFNRTFLGPRFGMLAHFDRNALRDEDFLQSLPNIYTHARTLGLDVATIHVSDPMVGIKELLAYVGVRG